MDKALVLDAKTGYYGDADVRVTGTMAQIDYRYA